MEAGSEPPPDKLNVKTGPHLRYTISRLGLLFWLSVSCCFLRLSYCFPVISGFSIVIHIRIHYHFSTFFLPLRWASGPHSVKFPLPGSNL